MSSAHITALFNAAQRAFVIEKSGVALTALVDLVHVSTPAHFDLAKHRSELGIPQMIPIVSTDDFDITIFTVPKEKKLPLHDHPGMLVITKVLEGSAKVNMYR